MEIRGHVALLNNSSMYLLFCGSMRRGAFEIRRGAFEVST